MATTDFATLLQPRRPAEWENHRSTLLAFPAAAALWQQALPAAQQEWRNFAALLTQSEPIVVLASPQWQAVLSAQLQLPQTAFIDLAYGDIWLRDTAPIFIHTARGVTACCFRFNGWGEKFVLPGDSGLSQRLASILQVPAAVFDFVLEGGAIDSDGLGTGLSTQQCLLHPNRQHPSSLSLLNQQLQQTLGLRHMIWLNAGLVDDHTDGHVDNVARFVAPGCIAALVPYGPNDRNYEVLTDNWRCLQQAVDVLGRPLQLIALVAPAVAGQPASYCNFYIGNRVVVVPQFGVAQDSLAVAALRPCFPGRTVIGLPAGALLTGGGTFHCLSQEITT